MDSEVEGYAPEHIPPQDLDAEQATLGAMILGSREAAGQVVELLKAEDFYREAHAVICRACFNLYERNEGVDAITLASELKAMDRLDDVGGLDYIDRLVRITPFSTNAAHYAAVVREKSTLRRLLFATQRISARCYEPGVNARELLDSAGSSILSLAQSQDRCGFEPLKSILVRVNAQVEERYYGHGGVTGVPTGFTDLDRMLAGLQPGDLIVLAARPSMGKTSLAVNMAMNAALRSEHPVPVGIFSLEMDRDQLGAGMICTEAQINLGRLRTGRIRDGDWLRLAEANETLSHASIYIDDTGSLSPLELRAKARRLRSEHGLGLIVVDYLGMMRSDERTENRVNEVSAITRSLKALAKELGVPMVLCCQLNRGVESRENKRPMLSDLRDSGQIEADADVVLFIFRESYYERKAAGEADPVDDAFEDDPAPEVSEIIIAKQRNGPTGTVKVGFIKQQKRFVNLERGHDFD